MAAGDVGGAQQRLAGRGPGPAAGDDQVEDADSGGDHQGVGPAGDHPGAHHAADHRDHPGEHARHQPDVDGEGEHQAHPVGHPHQGAAVAGRHPPDGEEAAQPDGDEDASLHRQPLHLAEEVLDGQADHGAEDDEGDHPHHRRSGRRRAGRCGGRRPRPRRPGWCRCAGRGSAGRPRSPAARRSGSVPRPGPGSRPGEAAGRVVRPCSPTKPRPAVAHHAAGERGGDGEGHEDQRVEAAGGDEQAAGHQHHLAGSEGEGDPRLLGEEQAAEEDDGDDTVEPCR